MKMNRLDNILTLTWGVHDAFDNLDMWFEEMPVSISLILGVIRKANNISRDMHTDTKLSSLIQGIGVVYGPRMK